MNYSDNPHILARKIEETYTELVEADPRFRTASGVHPDLCGRWAPYVPVRCVRTRFRDSCGPTTFGAAIEASCLAVVTVLIPSALGSRIRIVKEPGEGLNIPCLHPDSWVTPARAPAPHFQNLIEHLRRVRDILRSVGECPPAFEAHFLRLCRLTEHVTVDLELLAVETLKRINKLEADVVKVHYWAGLSVSARLHAKAAKKINVRSLNPILQHVNPKNRRTQP